MENNNLYSIIDENIIKNNKEPRCIIIKTNTISFIYDFINIMIELAMFIYLYGSFIILNMILNIFIIFHYIFACKNDCVPDIKEIILQIKRINTLKQEKDVLKGEINKKVPRVIFTDEEVDILLKELLQTKNKTMFKMKMYALLQLKNEEKVKNTLKIFEK